MSPFPSSLATLLVSAIWLAVPFSSQGQGVTQYWTGIVPPPTDGTSIATENITSGIWDATTPNWANDYGASTTFHAFTPGNSRIAGFRPRSGGYTVTLVSDIANFRALNISGGNSDGVLTIEGDSQRIINFTNKDSYISVASGRELVIGNGLAFFGNLKQIGGGTQRWSGDATAYSGTFSIESGTFIVDTDATTRLNSSSVLVLNGGHFIYNGSGPMTASLSLTKGRLSGNGTIEAPITVGNDVTLSPGNGVGRQEFNNLTLASAGTFEWEIQSWQGTTAGSDFDQINAHQLNITAKESTPFTITLKSLSQTGTSGALSDFDGRLSREWTLFDTATITDPLLLSRLAIDQSAFLTLNSTATGTFSLALNDGSVKLVYTAVPEPAAIALLGLIGCVCRWPWLRKSLK